MLDFKIKGQYFIRKIFLSIEQFLLQQVKNLMPSYRILSILLGWVLLLLRESNCIYKAPTVFYSSTFFFKLELCILGSPNALSGTFTCSLTDAQIDIIRVGLALSEFSKPNYKYNVFKASALPTSSSASSVDILVDITKPTEGMRMSFFVIIIKAQPVQKYIDLIHLNFPSGSSLQTINGSPRSINQPLDITLLTIFPTGTAGLNLIPFTTSFKLLPRYDNDYSDDLRSDDIMKFQLSTTISGTDIVAKLVAQNQTRIFGFTGIILVINPPQVTIAVTNLRHMTFFRAPYTIGNDDDYNLTIIAPSFGPNFNSKCILGINTVEYEGQNDLDFYFHNSTYGFYQLYDMDSDDDSDQSSGVLFCFGNSTECGQGATYWDLMINDCYTAQKCPLPVPAGWTYTTQCPNCTQIICQECTVTNRSNCLLCGDNSTLANGACTCNSDHIPINMSISTSALGQWNGVSNSLHYCHLNCSMFMIGCLQLNCTNETYCTKCGVGYLFNLISSDIQKCSPCSSFIPHCLQCSNDSTCTLCDTGYYVMDSSSASPGSCDLCTNPLLNCATCSSSTVCITCQIGYTLNTTTKTCYCDPVVNFLTNCLTCTVKTACDSCTTNLYFVSSTDSLCHLCKDFDPQCLQCSGQNICDLCTTGYIPNPNIDGTILCALCSVLITNCTTCTSPTVCTDCTTFSGITSTDQCQSCNKLISGCLTCDNYSTCLTCDNSTVLYNGQCYFCLIKIPKCINCYLDINSVTICTQCLPGSYLSNNQCLSCLKLFNYCLECTQTTCQKCMSPYELGLDNTCSQCISGYWLVSGYCINIAGCQTAITALNGSQVCIACIRSLNFVFNQKLNKCVCLQGFQQFHQIAELMQCLPICGDGLVLTVYEQCDDANLIDKDGCSSACTVEKDFLCDLGQPSKCTLHLRIDSFTFNYAYRVLGQNKGILSFLIEPKHQGLQKMDWSKLIKFNFSKSAVNPSSLSFSYSSSTGELLVTVPYNEELQSQYLETNITFDSKIIISQPSSFMLSNKLNGINAALVFQEESMLSTHKNINILSLVIMILLLLQFYVGSYFHKMIGLQTIQVIQSIYFVRMVAPSDSTSILNSMNAIQYSACGYENAELLYGSLQEVNSQAYGVLEPQFTAINMKKYFLLNVNLSLIPIFIILLVYLVSLVRKFNSRNKYLQQKQQQEKDKYTNFRRSAEWIYDHFVFPWIMMFYLISFFYSTLQLSSEKLSTQKGTQNLQLQSFSVHIIMVFMTLAIYCYETFASIKEYTKYRMTQKQKQRAPTSIFQKLQHDQNYLDRPNYHPAYILVYLIYYLVLSLIMVLQVLMEGFSYSLEFVLGLSVCYFLLICIWKPYHEATNWHNHFLKLYYGTFVLFLAICYFFSRVSKMSNTLYIALIYVIMCLVTSIMIAGFVRIFLERMFRKSLQQNNSLLRWVSPNEIQQLSKDQGKNDKLNNELLPKKTMKKKNLILNNSYAFQNQLLQFSKKSGIQPQIKGYLDKDKKNTYHLSQQQQDFLICKIRQDYAQKGENIFLQSLIPKQQHLMLQQSSKNNSFNQNLHINPLSDVFENQINSQAKQGPSILTEQENLLKELKQKLKKQWILKNNF